MNAVLTAEFIASIPEPEPDNAAPAPAADAEFTAWLAASAGLARDEFTTDALLHETRGED